MFTLIKFQDGTEKCLFKVRNRYAISVARTASVLKSSRIESINTFECCKKMKINNFSSFGIPHFYCSSCKSHVYNEKTFTAAEWLEIINKPSE